MKKILILADNFASGGGTGEIARIQAEELSKKNSVEVLTAHLPDGFHSHKFRVFLYKLAYDHRLRNYLGLYNPKAVKILKNHLSSNHYDECHVHNLHTNWSYYCLKVLKEANIRTVLTFHDVVAVTPYVKLCQIKYAKKNEEYVFDYRYSWARHLRDAKLTFNPFRNFFIRKFIGNVDVVKAVSWALADFLKANKIRVDKVEHNKLPAGAEAAPGIYEDSIFFGGRISTSKGALFAVQYLAELKKKSNLSPRLLIAGKTGIATEKMLNLSKRLGVADQIEFLGWLDDQEYHSVMEQAGLVIVPSICFDSFPTIILEAMRAARPVVATIFGGSREMVEEGSTGFVHDPANIEEVCRSIGKLLKDKDLAKDMGKRAYEKFRSEFSY